MNANNNEQLMKLLNNMNQAPQHRAAEPAKKRRIHRSIKEWRALVDRQRRSGMSGPQFCESENICYGTFNRWRNLLEDAQIPTAPHSAKKAKPEKAPEVKPEAAESDNAVSLDLSALIIAAQSGMDITINLGNGIEMRLGRTA